MKTLSGFLIVGTLLFSACKSSETTPSDSISVGLRQSAHVGADVVVRVDSIQDSRCPVNVVCFWAGRADVKLTLLKDTDSSAVHLASGFDANGGKPRRLDSTNVSLGKQNYTVILREVNPYPGTSNRPQTAVIQVTKL